MDAMWQDMVTHMWMCPQKLSCITDWAHHQVSIKNAPWLFNPFHKIITINIIDRICSNPTDLNISEDSFTQLLKCLYPSSFSSPLLDYHRGVQQDIRKLT